MKKMFLILGLMACVYVFFNFGTVVLGISHLYQSIIFSESKVEKEVLDYLKISTIENLSFTLLTIRLV
ncbi:hypothetical protein DNH61_03795 [Paenibacillus sambharensis]|uniref:Uncharacterized protein n=1 Tax=Paenibacillus sambharensis TaxID=1803190 RepID=A0A2W1LAD1_9BACL|nr:hypothetical protein DNH61_03795 [Paenibacillus sambharensis]